MNKKISKLAKSLLEEQDVLTQCKTELELSKQTLLPKRVQWAEYLRLYNNAKRDKEAIGNSLLYSLFNTLFSFLYFDKLTVSFDPVESGDVDKCDLITKTAKFDYEAMKMPIVEYDWDWDALFFSTGILYIGAIDKKNKVPQIEVIDPFTFYIDPEAPDIHNARFIAIERTMTKEQMREKGFKNIDKLGNPPKAQTETKKAQLARKQAQNEVNTDEPLDYENKEFVILKWFTHRNGRKVSFYTDYNCSVLLTPVEDLIFKDNEFPIVLKHFSPIPHELFGISVPDLAGDKQRASAVLMNLAIAMEKSKLYPQYLYDKNAILNVNDLKNFAFNKFIPAEPGNKSINDVVAPLRQQSMTNSTSAILTLIRDFAQRATGQSELRQGMIPGGRISATTMRIAQMNADARNSLAAKLFTFAEKEFWRKWLNRYTQFKSLVSGKVIRIQGALGVRFVGLDSDTFKFKIDPDISVQSEAVSEQKRATQIQQLVEEYKMMSDNNTSEASKRYYRKKILELSNFSKDEIDQILPPSFDELRAQEENKLLEKGKLPEIEPYDDHQIHISIHNKVPQNNKNKAVIIAHIQAHKKAFLEQRQKEKEMEYKQSQQKPKNNLPPFAQNPLNQGLGAQIGTKGNINGALNGITETGQPITGQPQVPQNPESKIPNNLM